jgi:hypothetical protein
MHAKLVPAIGEGEGLMHAALVPAIEMADRLVSGQNWVHESFMTGSYSHSAQLSFGAHSYTHTHTYEAWVSKY